MSLTFSVDAKLIDGSLAQLVLGMSGVEASSSMAPDGTCLIAVAFLNEANTAGLEGAILLETELTCAVSDHPVGAPTTYKGTPHTQYATEHHAGRNHSDASNNPYYE